MPSSEAIAGTAKCRRQCIASDPGRISFSESHSTCNAKPRHQAALRRPPRCTWPEQDKHSVMMLQAHRKGEVVPVFGDLDGDGVRDCVIRLDNGNREMSQDPGIPVELEAFTSY